MHPPKLGLTVAISHRLKIWQFGNFFYSNSYSYFSLMTVINENNTQCEQFNRFESEFEACKTRSRLNIDRQRVPSSRRSNI